MKKDQLQKMIALHESLLKRVKDTLDEHYYELEEKGVEGLWLSEYTKQKEILEWLYQQQPDDS